MNESALLSLASVLWQERQELDDLLYALVSQQLVITAGQTRWLARADAQVETAMTAFRDSEILRSIEVQTAAEHLGLSADASLQDLADACTEPWTTTFSDHRQALRDLTAEIATTVAENQRLLKAGAQAVGETLSRLGNFVSTYDSHGGSVRSGDTPTFLDEQA